MSNQVSLSGFQEQNVQEQLAFENVLPYLKAAAEEIGADPNAIALYEAKSYSSIYYEKNNLIFRLKLRGKIHYIEISAACESAILFFSNSAQYVASQDYIRIILSNTEDNPLAQHIPLLETVLKDVIRRMPKEWDCCSRYLECSNARKCVHPNLSFSLGCGYRKILAEGRVFFGANRNID